jgi:peroxiredoxin
MGMLVDKSNLGFGMRSWRYAMVVNDGKVEKMFIEPGFRDNADTDPFEVSDADTVLNWLKAQG